MKLEDKIESLVNRIFYSKTFTTDEGIHEIKELSKPDWISCDDRLIELTKRYKKVMDDKNIIIQVYTNASGFLWALSKLDSGTNLGWSGYVGDCENSNTFTSYENALEDALNLIDKCDLDRFRKEINDFHWGNYSKFISDNYR
jgi:hypothetical protein